MRSELTALGAGVRPNRILMDYIERFGVGMSILDYGAGKGRHSKFLRDRGFKVYGYDPFLGKEDVDPWKYVSNVLPLAGDMKFGIVFTAFVLNVLKPEDAADVVSSAESLTDYLGETLHIVREDLRLLGGRSVMSGRGTYQRDVRIDEMTNLGYERLGKLFVKYKGSGLKSEVC